MGQYIDHYRYVNFHEHGKKMKERCIGAQKMAI